MYQSKNIQLLKRPNGFPSADCFALVEETLPEIKAGQVIIKNLWMSVDPYMRGRMSDAKSYIPPFELNQTLQGSAIGEVIASEHPSFSIGDKVSSMLGWRQYALSDGSMLQKLPNIELPEQSFLGAAGMPGLTAWVGLMEIAKLQEGETVLVSAASGAVGSLVCQFAKLKGCRVIATAGSLEKIKWLESIGVDAAINYKDYPDATQLTQALAVHCIDGVDVYFESVGGDHMQAALSLMNRYGRIAACGMIGTYNQAIPAQGPNNLSEIIKKSLSIQGFIVSDYWHCYEQYLTQLVSWYQQDKIRWQETIKEGIEAAPDALIGLFKGENIGKMLIKL